MRFAVETCVDFVLWLEKDMFLNILMRLNDPADVVCAAAVSRLWYQFEFGTLRKCALLWRRVDFVLWLESDVSLSVLMCLDDPADVVCAGAVLRLWRQFVATNGISKQLCLRKFPQLSRIALIKFPQLSRIALITEPDSSLAEGKDVESSSSRWETLKRDHNFYAFLLRDIEISDSCTSDCIGNAASDSSTDGDDPDESIWNTLIPC